MVQGFGHTACQIRLADHPIATGCPVSSISMSTWARRLSTIIYGMFVAKSGGVDVERCPVSLSCSFCLRRGTDGGMVKLDRPKPASLACCYEVWGLLELWSVLLTESVVHE